MSVINLGEVWRLATEVGRNIIYSINENNDDKSEIKMLKHDCKRGCNQNIKDRLEELDLLIAKKLQILKNVKKELPRKLDNVAMFENTDKEITDFKNWVSHYEKKMEKEEEIYSEKYEKMSEILARIPQDDEPYDDSYRPITPSPPSPINWDDALGEGHKRKKTIRRRRKTKAKKKKRKRKTKRKKKY